MTNTVYFHNTNRDDDEDNDSVSTTTTEQSPATSRRHTTSGSVTHTPLREGGKLEISLSESFSFKELEDSLGWGVFKGWIDENNLVATKPGKGIPVAIKRCMQQSFQEHDEWQAEVEYLGKLYHPNLVRLFGYCLDDEEHLLVYEFMPRGSLDYILSRSNSPPLSWSVRMKIALGAAKGLAFLHSAAKNVIHPSVKSSNILLDSVRSFFGVSGGVSGSRSPDILVFRPVPTDRSYVSTEVVEDHRFITPEYVSTGHLTAESDVYRFGALLMEIMSGEPVGLCGEYCNLLGEFSMSEIFLLRKSRAAVHYSLAGLACQCLSEKAHSRPNMDEVVTILEQLQVLEREQIMNKCQAVTAQLEEALGGISYENLDISDEVKEQVELVLGQFRRAKGRIDTSDAELYDDVLSVYNMSNDPGPNPAVLKRLAEKLQLMSIIDLNQESLALHEMVGTSGGDPGESIEKMSMLLRKLKDFLQTENPDTDAPVTEKCLPSGADTKVSTDANRKSPVIPDDFRCPVSLELMKDPVIVSTGQTYERVSIEKWLEAGHGTCPKTQQKLTSTVLRPNYVLRSLIAQWCENNGVEPPKRPGSCMNSKSTSVCPAERAKVDALVCKLTSGNIEDQRSAAGELRLLAKRNADNRVCIAQAGAIPLLVGLLSICESRTQEHAVTALLNLSICEDNKGSIISCGALPGIVQVLKKGSMEARENAAATLFSLSVVDENKVTIGSSGAIPALVTLLNEGSQRGKKDAATALFNLCIYQGNKGRAVRAGVVPTLMRLLTEPGGGMVDEALAILAILASHSEGKIAIGSAEAVPALVEVIRSGSPRNKENAAAVLVHLCSADQQYLVDAQELGLMGPLFDMAQNGTDRGRRKAGQLLERMNRFIEQQKPVQVQAEAQLESHTQQSQPPSTTNSVHR